MNWRAASADGYDEVPGVEVDQELRGLGRPAAG